MSERRACQGSEAPPDRDAGGTVMQDVQNDKLLLIKIEGMHCHKCEAAIRKALSAQPGVHEVEVDFPSKMASVLFDPTAVQVKDLTASVGTAGYRVAGFTLGHADAPSAS
jgi:copper chaperone CopZ